MKNDNLYDLFEQWAKELNTVVHNSTLNNKYAFYDESRYEKFYITGEDLFEAFKKGVEVGKLMENMYKDLK